MAALRFRTPHIEELVTAHSRQAPGFAWVAVPGAPQEPAKGGAKGKRVAAKTPGQTEQQREALTARQLREIERRIKDLNDDNPRETQNSKKDGPGPVKAGKTQNTKKILNSGKGFSHHLDDEVAEIGRTGRRDGDLDVAVPVEQRASKTPLARRKVKEGGSMSSSPAPQSSAMGPPPPRGLHTSISMDDPMEIDSEDDEDDPLPPLPTLAEIEALLNAPPLTYNQARSAPPPPGVPPPRKFCESCGYWGRMRCMKCGVVVCSVECKESHDHDKCLKMYA